MRSHDSLTGLPNRSMLMERLDSDIRNGESDAVVLALIDVDDFKSVNDTMGHAGGDALLVEVAKRLEEIVKETNGLGARLGGDEFAITATLNKTLGTAEDLGRLIKDKMSENFQFERGSIQPKCSIGLSCLKDIEQRTRTELLKTADAALYEAKANGKNMFMVFDERIKLSIIRRDKLATHLPKAVRKGEISVALQPKMCLKTGSLVGFEALARWDLDGQPVSPVEFIPIAETTGIVRELDLAVLRAAAQFSVSEEKRIGMQVPISVNICAIHFHSSSLVRDVRSILTETGLRPENLTLEITESVVVENRKRVHTTFAALRKWGIKISLDDFGTGYSSLSYLRSFKFDEIKIDREFVLDIDSNQDTKFIFMSIIKLAHGLGSSIVVEGVETGAQLGEVKASQACIGQGYLFGKPLEVDQARAFLTSMHKNVA